MELDWIDGDTLVWLIDNKKKVHPAGRGAATCLYICYDNQTRKKEEKKKIIRLIVIVELGSTSMDGDDDDDDDNNDDDNEEVCETIETIKNSNGY